MLLRPQPFNRRRNESRHTSSQIWLLFKLWQPKPAQKESKPPNPKARIEMFWISQVWLLFQVLAAKTCPKVIKVTKPENQNYRNWNEWIESARFDYFFNLWQPKPAQKESKSPNQKIRIIELKWIESARLGYFFNLWQPKPVNLESKSPNQKVRIIEIEMKCICQIWLLFQSLAAKTCPKGIKVTKPEDQNYRNWNELNQPDLITFSIFGSQNLPKRNQSHQTRGQNYRNWNEVNQADLIPFSIFGSQNPSKRNQSHQTRRSEL